MKQERVILSFIMVLIGLLVAGIAFYLYQGTKKVPSSKTAIVTPSPSPAPISTSVYLSVDNPVDESVTANKTIKVSGKTTPGATVVIITNSDEDVVEPSSQGDFSTNITATDGQNLIQITAFGPDGQSVNSNKTVTYTTEDF
jgi:flagellar basal body-associated protein FliL